MNDISRRGRLGLSSTGLSAMNLMNPSIFPLKAGFIEGRISGSSISSSSASYSGVLSDLDLEASDGESVKQSLSSESQALYGNENIVTDMKPDYIRWFYKYEKDLKWTPFAGYDSIRMEQRYRHIVNEREESQQHKQCYFFEDGPTALSSIGYFVTNSSSHYSNGIYHHHPPRESKSTNESNDDEQRKSYTDKIFCIGCSGGGSSPSEECVTGNAIVVRGGLYEADLETWTCSATYWPGDKCQITRGSWFYDGTWQPLSVEHAEKLEEDHLGQFIGHTLDLYPNSNSKQNPQQQSACSQPTKLSVGSSGATVLHRVSFTDFHVDWTSPTEIHLFNKAASHKFMRSVGLQLGFQAWGYRLCRGYFKPALLTDKPPEISHIVFVIHGIGQKMDTGRIVRNCSTFRDMISSLKDKYYPHLNDAKYKRAEFFPVEWRSSAKLDDDIVNAITPHKLMSLRQILNATAMDIMYYTSPLYRSEITNALRNELNRIYSNFLKRNPDFVTRGGKVSVIAHSLGAVLTYDIVTGYTPDFSGGPTQKVQDSSPEAPGLLFTLEHFFCFGSPLAVFLALRWKNPHKLEVRKQHILPDKLCRRIYNIFCLTDPVAYRLEPLLNKAYMLITPLLIYQYGTLGKQKYDDMPREKIIREPAPSMRTAETPVSVFTNAMSDNSSSVKSSQTPTTLKKESNSNKWGWFGIMKYMKSSEDDPEEPETEESDKDLMTVAVGRDELISQNFSSSKDFIEGESSSTPAELSSHDIPNDLDYRIDYVLKENAFTNSYIAALTSHTNYWTSLDTAFFVLTHLYEGLIDCPSQFQQ